MAQRAPIVAMDGLTQVDTAKRYVLGTEVSIGNDAFIYMQGVTSGAAGAWVTYTSAGVTTLLAGNAIGRVGIMMSALDATTKYGWAQLKGTNTLAKTDTVAADKALYIDGTAGRADDAVVSGDLILNAFSLAADVSNVCTVWINYPSVTDTVS